MATAGSVVTGRASARAAGLLAISFCSSCAGSAGILPAGTGAAGLAIYKPTQFAWLASLLGGYMAARFEHFLLALGYVLFFLIHIAQVIRAGWNNFRGMVSGYELVSSEEGAHE